MSATAMRVRTGGAFSRGLGSVLRSVALTGLAIVGGGFVVFVATLDRSETVPGRHVDGIVALTGGADRVSDALDLLIAGRGDRLLISGVNPTVSGDEVMRNAPEARRLLACCIDLGYAAENTVGNARETRDWVRRHAVHSLIVVTSDYHMPRALAEIADAAPGMDLVPFPVTTDKGDGHRWWSDPQRLRTLLVEYLKYLVVLARTHLHPAAPVVETTASPERQLLPQGGPCSSCARSSSTSSSTSS